MPRIVVPQVRRGDPITAELWNAMTAAVAQCRIVAGLGTRVSEVSGGSIVDFDFGGGFAHPWLASLRGQNAASIRPGTINGLEATIKGVALSDDPAPVLEWDEVKLDASGSGLIAAEVTVDTDTLKLKSIEMVQVADPDAEDGEAPEDGSLPLHGGAAAALEGGRARWPIARLRQREDGTLVLFQIVYFNLTHRAVRGEDGGIARHFFFA